MLRVFTSFSGYDSQCMALDRLPIDYELVGWSEIDKYAIQAHNAVYPQWADRNFGDITKIDWAQVPDFDLFTYSSPCQDFSQAGLQRGGEKGSGTRSSLLWECQKAIEAKRPKYCLMENVAALVSGKFIRLFNHWQLTLESMGYKNFAQVLNAKDYGVPQNRERIFLVSIHDVDARFEFPKAIKLERRLKDVLETNVDERYYLSNSVIDNFNAHKERNAAKGNGFGWNPTDGDVVGNAVLTGNLRPADNYLIPAQSCCEGGGLETKIGTQNFRIRKLTERECFRLMDVSESDIDKIQAAKISRTQQYKMAGNSIVVACLEGIFRRMFVDTEPTELKLFY